MAALELKGGAKLEKRLAQLALKVAKPATLRVGFLENSSYPEKEGSSGKIGVATVAAVQEFGAPKVGIPPRPYFRSMIKQKGPTWGAVLGLLLKNSGFNATESLRNMGKVIDGQLKASIKALEEPALSEVTLMLRMMKAKNPKLVVTGKTVGIAAARVAAGERATGVSKKPLIESGFLYQSVHYDVKT